VINLHTTTGRRYTQLSIGLEVKEIGVLKLVLGGMDELRKTGNEVKEVFHKRYRSIDNRRSEFSSPCPEKEGKSWFQKGGGGGRAKENLTVNPVQVVGEQEWITGDSLGELTWCIYGKAVKGGIVT